VRGAKNTKKNRGVFPRKVTKHVRTFFFCLVPLALDWLCSLLSAGGRVVKIARRPGGGGGGAWGLAGGLAGALWAVLSAFRRAAAHAAAGYSNIPISVHKN
jgi:hypothetical protein